jgi:hypothetical protein
MYRKKCILMLKTRVVGYRLSVIRHQFSNSTKSKREEFGILSKILLKIIVERYSIKAMGIEKVKHLCSVYIYFIK